MLKSGHIFGRVQSEMLALNCLKLQIFAVFKILCCVRRMSSC